MFCVPFLSRSAPVYGTVYSKNTFVINLQRKVFDIVHDQCDHCCHLFSSSFLSSFQQWSDQFQPWMYLWTKYAKHLASGPTFLCISFHSAVTVLSWVLLHRWDAHEMTYRNSLYITDHPHSSDQTIPFFSKSALPYILEQFAIFSNGHFKTCSYNDGSIVFAFF